MTHGWQWTMFAVGSTLVLAGCGSSSPPPTTSTTVPTTTTAATTTTAPTQNLPLTTSVTQSLLVAGAASHQLTAANYTGLAPGTTFYAYDPSTMMYYAAAALVPSSSSYRAQVSNQDDGSYLLFTQRQGSSLWTVYNDGLGGVAGTTCPIMLPAAVLAAWQWTSHSCYPPS